MGCQTYVTSHVHISSKKSLSLPDKYCTCSYAARSCRLRKLEATNVGYWEIKDGVITQIFSEGISTTLSYDLQVFFADFAKIISVYLIALFFVLHSKILR